MQLNTLTEYHGAGASYAKMTFNNGASREVLMESNETPDAAFRRLIADYRSKAAWLTSLADSLEWELNVQLEMQRSRKAKTR